MRPPVRPRLIFIHGAWAGAWVWHDLLRRLTPFGWACEAIELPGNGHHPVPCKAVCEADYRASVVQAITRAPGSVVLIGHSGGGMLVTAGADACPDQVIGGVWIAGMLLPDGEGFDTVTHRLPGDTSRFGVAPFVEPSPDGLATTVPTAMARRFFFHDLEEADAQRVALRLTPQPTAGRRILTHAGPAFEALPKLYICATQDRSVVPAAQRAMCEKTRTLTRVDMRTGHVPHVSHAERCGAILVDWLEALVA